MPAPQRASLTSAEKAANETGKPSRTEAEDAVRVLLRWAGDDPAREGLIDTPARVVRSYEEFFSGYNEDPVDIFPLRLPRSL